MKPSAQQMLEAAQKALAEQVAPHATDQWAASALRSVDVILGHLRARVSVEGPMLYQDNQDLATLLAWVAGPADLNLGQQPALGQGIAAFLADQEALVASGYPPVDDLSDLNIRGRALVDQLLLACHAQRDAGAAGAVHAALRAYLERHIAREHDFFFPVFVGRPV